MNEQPQYRDVLLPGLGRMKVPFEMTDDQVLAQINAPDEEATPQKKTRKKP